MTSKFAGLGLAVDRPLRVNLLSPLNGEPLKHENGEPAYIEVLSLDSKKAREARRGLNGRKDSTREDERAEIMAALTVGWSLCSLAGKPLNVAFSASDARDLYLDPATSWTLEQVEVGAALRANFSPIAGSA